MRGTIYYISGLLLTLTIISGVVLTSSTSSAETTSANASVIVPSACTFTATEDTAHTAEIPNGTYQANIGTTTLKTICNDSEGFSIYAIGFSNSEYGNNKLLATVAGSLSPTNDINTGTNTSGSPSSWAMKLAQSGTGAPTILSGYDNYSNVPSTNTKVATLVPSTSTSATTGSSITATYAANISGTQPAGIYNGKVKYTMVHPASETPLEPKAATPKCISYWPNASGVADSMADDCNSGPSGSGYGNNATANLWASNFKRDGYGFAGWSDKFDWVLNENDANGNGTGANAGYHIYGPNATITTPADMVDKGLSLYAVWVKSSGNLQSWNYCAVLNTGDVTALTDTRDNETYAIAKLADGNCWMIENLRLDNQYTTSATDIAKSQGYNSSFIGLANPETANFSYSTTANSLYSTDGTTSAPAITGSSAGYRFPRYNNQNTATPATNMTDWNNNANIYSVGNWYTWPAAIADTSYYYSKNQTISGTSICPTGWKLPSGGQTTVNTTANYYVLTKTLMNNQEPDQNATNGFGYYSNSVTNTAGKTATAVLGSYPNNFIYSGFFGSGSPYNRGWYGRYWSSTVYNSSYSYSLNLDSSSVYPGTSYYNKNGGFSVRCIVDS